jgi:hypothetical protein
MTLKNAFTTSAIALGLLFAPATMAQPKKNQPQTTSPTTVTGGTAGGVQGRGVSANTSGTGTVISGSNGLQGAGVTGTADATAENGTATTRSDAKSNERRAMQRSSATAMTEEERARSRTRTMVTPNDVIRSRTTTTYKADGQKPMRDSVSRIVCGDGAVAEKMSDCKSPPR